MPLKSFVHGQSGDPKDGQRVGGEASPQAFRQLLCDHLPAGDSNESCDPIFLSGYICSTDVVSKLVLTGEALKKPIEFDVATAKFASIVSRFQPPNANFEIRATHGAALSALQQVGLPG